MEINTDFLIVLASAAAAAISFAAFVIPILNRSDKKSHYRETIDKQKKALFESAKTNDSAKVDKTLSGRDSMAALFKVQQLAGEMGEKVRIMLLQAGIRDPMAPIFYFVAQIVLPLILLGVALLVTTQSEKEISQTVELLMYLGAIVIGFFLPRVLVKNTAQKRQQELGITFPDALDMMLICVQGGIGLEQAVERVAEEVSDHSPILAEELGILSAEMAMLNDRRAALSDFGKRVGGFGKSFATALIQAEQYGTSVSQALRTISLDLRDIRMAKAEQKAASLPPKLTVPMILFFLPALFIVILGPAGIQASQAGVGG
ncbi:MAG: type II secretion system F family protein [Pseudomonadota bacterium]